MAESTTAGEKRLKLDDVAKNSDFPPPTIKSTQGTKDVCNDCEIYKATIENLTVKTSKLEDENEKLREVIKDLLVETGKSPENLNNLLAPAVKGAENLKEDAQEFSSARKAFSTCVILGQVFGYFDDLSLLRFRPVCKFWADEISSRIQLRIQLFHNPEENTLGKSGVGILPDLLNLMKSAVEAGRKSPFTRFWLTSPNLMTVPGVVQLFEKFGHQMEYLALDLLNSETFPMTYRDLTECLRNVLFKWAPNLKFFSFSLDSWPFKDSSSLLNIDGESSYQSLPNVQILRWYNPDAGRYIYLDLLKSCPNLKKILHFPASFGMEQAIEANKAGAIKELNIEFGRTLNFGGSVLPLASEHCFQVEEIKLVYVLGGLLNRILNNPYTHPEQWRPNIQLLNKTLRNNSNCLKKIKCQNLGPLAEYGLEIPVMPNLKTLDMTTELDLKVVNTPDLSVEDFFRIFPKGLDVATTFPKLAHISWNIQVRAGYSPDTKEAIETFYQLPVFAAMCPLTSVRSLTLTIVNQRNIEFLGKIAVCLPNVKVLKYHEQFGPCLFPESAAEFKLVFLDFLGICWKLFQGLEEIHLFPFLKQKPKTGFLKHKPAQLVDSAITGLDLATVRKLTDKNEFPGKSQNVSAYQEKDDEAPSIRNMKSLRYLKISVESEHDYPIFTHVSGTHGFGLMSNLTVVIEATREKSLVIQDPEGLMSTNVKFRQIPRKPTRGWF